MTHRDTADSLARYATELTVDDLDQETVAAAKVRIVDSIASGLGAVRFPEPTVERVVEFSAGRTHGAEARILGTDRTAPVEYAAFANATLIRYLDWNDYHAEENRHGTLSFGHASSNLGALLSVADAYDVSGEDLLLATVLAYELHLRFANETAQHDDGLDHVNYGLVATSLAAGRLRGLSIEELAEAVNIALSSHIALYQTRCGELTEWKGIAFGNTARNAIVAVELARAGIHGPSPIFEGEAGFSNLLTHPVELFCDEFGGNAGDYEIHRTNLKLYPVCGALMRPLDAAFALSKDHGIDWREITEIEVATHDTAIDLTAAEEEKWDPKNRNTADHSLPYCVARAFVDGEIGPQQFTDEKIADSEVRELMDLISVVETSAATTLEVETASGTFEKSVEQARGHHQNPFTEEELAQKVRTAMGESSMDGAAGDLLAWAEDLEGRPSISNLFDIASS